MYTKQCQIDLNLFMNTEYMYYFWSLFKNQNKVQISPDFTSLYVYHVVKIIA